MLAGPKNDEGRMLAVCTPLEADFAGPLVHRVSEGYVVVEDYVTSGRLLVYELGTHLVHPHTGTLNQHRIGAVCTVIEVNHH